jgi:signal transduction histidine kinase
MSGFSDLLDKGFLFACCLAFFLCQPDLDAGVVPMILAVICSGLLSFFDDSGKKTALVILFAISSCFMPTLVFFLPLILYDMSFRRFHAVDFFCAVPLVLFFTIVSLQTGVVIAILAFTGLLMKYRIEALTALNARYRELNDTTGEMTKKLKNQHRALLEKQDDELNLATLNERNRIAREIHDNVGHLLSSALLQSGALLAVNRDEEVERHLEAMGGTLAEAMNSIRSSIHNLHEESVDLFAQLQGLLKPFSFCEMSLDYQVSNDPEIKLKYAFIAICKEALANIMKHSNATHGSIALREHPAFYQLVIRDNGNMKSNRTGSEAMRAIHPGNEAAKAVHAESGNMKAIHPESGTMKTIHTVNGMGLANITERVHSFNGHINITTDNGFEIFISIPKEGF